MMLGHREPLDYYRKEAEREEGRLLGLGLLVETQIAIAEARSKKEIVKSLRRQFPPVGTYWRLAKVDMSNRVVALISKPEDAAAFEVEINK